MRSLYQCLLDIEGPHLQAIGRFWDFQITGSSRRDRASKLAETMTTARAATDAVAALSDDEQRSLLALRSAGGTQPVRVFARQWGLIRPMGPARMSREEPWQAPQSPAEGLWYKGFVFTEFRHTLSGSFETVAIPEDLLSLLPETGDGRPALALTSVTGPAASWSFADAMLDDLCTLLAYVHNVGIRPGDGEQWTDRNIATISKRLRNSDPAAVDLLIVLLHELGWVQTGETGELRLVSEPVTAWLQSTSAGQRETLADAWIESRGFRELLRIRSLRAKDPSAWYGDPCRTRRAILGHLASCSPATWYEMDRFIREIKRIDPDFHRPDGDYESWYIEERDTGRYLSGFESWEAVEGGLIAYALTRPLAWMGLVALNAADSGPGETMFRLTDDGAAYLGLADAVAAPDPEPLVALADFTVSVPAGRRFERFQLARVADWVSTGDPYAYRIGPSSLTRGSRHSIDVNRVAEFLKSSCRAPVPRPVLDTLVRWDTQRSEARLASVDLLTVSGEEIMTQIIRSPSASRYIVERIGPTAATVRRREWSKLIRELGRLAILPEVVVPDE